MSKRRADALGALLSATFLSCLFALLLLADQAFPPALVTEDGRLRAGIRAPVVAARGPAHVELDPPSVQQPPAVLQADTGEPVAGLDTETVTSGAGEARQGSGLEPGDGGAEPGPVVRGPSGGPGLGEPEPTGPKEKNDKVPPGHGGTPPGQEKKSSGDGPSPGHSKGRGSGGPGSSGGSGNGGVGTPPGHGGTPPGHAKDEDHESKGHGGKGRGKGGSKH